jgi:hypothetical protein
MNRFYALPGQQFRPAGNTVELFVGHGLYDTAKTGGYQGKGVSV